MSQGQSGTGDIVVDDGDVYMAWASNCCEQTWDTELKKFSGYGFNQELSMIGILIYVFHVMHPWVVAVRV